MFGHCLIINWLGGDVGWCGGAGEAFGVGPANQTPARFIIN